MTDWDKYIAPVFFSYRTNAHETTKIPPFFLVYGRNAKLPTDSTRIEEELTLSNYLDTQINELPIVRNEVQQRLQIAQQKQKDRHDDQLKRRITFCVNDKVLYYDAPLDKQWSGKLLPKWKGPFHISNVIGNGAYKIKTLDRRIICTPVNGSLLKLYKDPLPLDAPEGSA